MEPLRRHALVRATVAEIASAGMRDVTVAGIARRAGMSPALAHHYFGSKDRMLDAATGFRGPLFSVTAAPAPPAGRRRR